MRTSDGDVRWQRFWLGSAGSLTGAGTALITQFLATPPPGTAATQPTTPGLRDLTNRELEAMKMAADGKSNDEIARELHPDIT